MITDDRSNDAFDMSKQRIGLSQWPSASNELQNVVTEYQTELAELGKLGIVVGSEVTTQKPKKNTSRVDEFLPLLQ